MNISKFKVRCIATVVCAMSINACAYKSPTQQINNKDTAQITPVKVPFNQFSLDNGLTTIVHSDHSSPNVFVGVWYDVGSKDEPAGKTGFAHLFEHLMFGGSENYPHEYTTPLAQAGAVGLNGTTSFDRTNYYQTVPSNALDLALWMESDRMGYLLKNVTQEALDAERSIVKNEKRQAENRPLEKTNRIFQQHFYPKGHPYHHPTIGSNEDLNNANLEDVQSWFKDYYGANNVTLVLIGDITLEEAKAKTTQYFAEIPASKSPTRIEQWIPDLKDVKKVTIYDNTPQPIYERAFAIPAEGDYDSTLLTLVYRTLVGNENSPLKKRLIDELGLVTKIDGDVYLDTVTGQFSVSFHLVNEADIEQVERVIDQEIAKYIQEGPSLASIKNTNVTLKMELLERLQHKGGIASLLANSHLRTGQASFYEQTQQWRLNATPADLQQVAKKWLTKNYFEGVYLPEPKYQHTSTGADRSKLPGVGQYEAFKYPQINTTTLANGLTVAHIKNTSLPVVNIRLEVATGGNAEHQNEYGVAEATISLLEHGTKHLNQEAIADRQLALGIKKFVAAEDNISYISYLSSKDLYQSSLSLMSELMINPTFDETSVSKYKEKQRKIIESNELNPMNNIRDLLQSALYKSNSPLARINSVEKLNNITSARLKAFHKTEFSPQNTTLYIVGDIDFEQAIATAKQNFGQWHNDAQSQLREYGNTNNTGKTILVDSPGAPSSVLFAGLGIGQYQANKDEATEVMNSLFGGSFASRLNQNLREDKGWSYGVRSSIREKETGDSIFLINGSVQTDKTAESMQEIIKEFKEFTSSRKPTDAEIRQERNNKIRSFAGKFQNNGSFERDMAGSNKLGLPFNHGSTKLNEIKAIEPNEVRAIAQNILKPEELVWVIIGDLTKIEQKIKKLNIADVEVWSSSGQKIR